MCLNLLELSLLIFNGARVFVCVHVFIGVFISGTKTPLGFSKGEL